jgi:CHAD domain-containing protein
MAHLRRQTAALLEARAGIPDDAPGGVHASRVAARRLRSGLRVYGDLLTGDVAHRLRPELAWYAGVLAPARDLEVFAATLSRDSDDAHGYGDALLPWLERRRRAAVSDAASTLDGPRATSLLTELVATSRAPHFVDGAARRARKVLTPRVLRADQRATRHIDGLRPSDGADAWHGARIAAKRARYAAEVAAPALGTACDALGQLWASVTEPLGDAQDAVIQRGLVIDRIDDPTAPLSAGEAFVCGLFVASTHEREVESHRRARAVWRASRDEHVRLRSAIRS